jgi:hypothetical protein
MKNQLYQGTPTSRRFAACPSTIKAGDPVLIGGNVPAVALDDYQSNLGGTTFLLDGTFALEVIASSSDSPVVGAAIQPGDALYAHGTTDSTTGVVYNLTINKNSSDTAFGNLDPSYSTIAAGVTDSAAGVQI